MGIPTKSIGTKVSYAWETVAGTRPTAGYVLIPDIKETPDLNPESEKLETTTLLNIKNKRYTNGLQDFGTLPFKANQTKEIIDLHIQLIADYATKSALGLGLWVCVDVIGLDSCFLPVEPDAIGIAGGATNVVYDYTLNFSLVDDIVWATDPTYSTDTTYLLTFTVWAGAGTTAVDGATVTIFGGTAVVTDTNGQAQFALKAGTYDYKVAKSGITTVYGSSAITNANVNVAINGFTA